MSIWAIKKMTMPVTILEKSYPILFLDALRVNSRQDGKNINKALYVALAINWEQSTGKAEKRF